MRLLPRDERFFDLFTKVATLNVEAAKQLHVLLATDMDRRLPIVESIKRLEHEADIITHEVVTRLDRSFITPLDREDIHTLASRLDDVMDLMDSCSRKVQVFHAGDAPKGAILLAETIVGATEQLLAGGVLLGVREGSDYPEVCVQLAAGDLLVIHTDGLTEARRGEEEFGPEALRNEIKKKGSTGMRS